MLPLEMLLMELAIITFFGSFLDKDENLSVELLPSSGDLVPFSKVLGLRDNAMYSFTRGSSSSLNKAKSCSLVYTAIRMEDLVFITAVICSRFGKAEYKSGEYPSGGWTKESAWCFTWRSVVHWNLFHKIMSFDIFFLRLGLVSWKYGDLSW